MQVLICEKFEEMFVKNGNQRYTYVVICKLYTTMAGVLIGLAMNYLKRCIANGLHAMCVAETN